jgi:hypothetical protein
MYSQLLRHDKSSSGSGGAAPVRRWSTAASCWRRCQSIHPSTACCLLALSVAITLWAHQLEPNSAGAGARAARIYSRVLDRHKVPNLLHPPLPPKHAGARLRQMIRAVDPELLSPLPSAFDPAYSSPCWCAHRAGFLMALTGRRATTRRPPQPTTDLLRTGAPPHQQAQQLLRPPGLPARLLRPVAAPGRRQEPVRRPHGPPGRGLAARRADAGGAGGLCCRHQLDAAGLHAL